MKKDNESADEGKGNKAQEDRALATGTGLTKKWRTVLVVAATLVAFVFVLTQFVLPTIVPKRGRTITKSELTKAVAVDWLDTAEMTYEGVSTTREASPISENTMSLIGRPSLLASR